MTIQETKQKPDIVFFFSLVVVVLFSFLLFGVLWPSKIITANPVVDQTRLPDPSQAEKHSSPHVVQKGLEPKVVRELVIKSQGSTT